MNSMLTVYSIFQRTKIFSRIIFCKIRNSFIPISNRFAYFRLTSESSPIILNLSCRLFLKTRTLIYHACKIASYPDLYNQKTQANYRNRTALPRRFLSFGKTMFLVSFHSYVSLSIIITSTRVRIHAQRAFTQLKFLSLNNSVIVYFR